MFDSVLNRPLELLTIFEKSFILDVWLGSRQASDILKKDKNCEKPVKELFLKTLQLRLRNNFLHSCFLQVL